MTVPTGFPLAESPLIGGWPRVLIQIAWNAGGNSTAPNHWYTVSKRLRGEWKATLAGRQYELDTVTSGALTFKLDNLDGAFDPDNTTSPYYPYVLPYRRARLVAQTNPSQNLLYYWVANGTKTLSMAASTGTMGLATGLSASPSGLTTAQTWTIPTGTGMYVGFGLAGGVQSWTGHDCEGTTVTPGAFYTTGVDLQMAPGGMTSLNCQVKIAWYDLVGNSLGQSAGPNVAVTTTWQRTTVGGTAPAGAAFGLVLIVTLAATTATTTIRTTGWQLEEGGPTAWAASGEWFQLWQGFVERWPQGYEQNGKYGLVDVTCVDALAPLSQLTYQDVMPGYLAQTQSGSLQCVYDLASVSTSRDVPPGKAFLPYAGAQLATGCLDVVGANITYNTSITSTSDLGTLWGVPGPVTTLANNQAASLGTSAGATTLQPWDGTDHLMLPNGGWTRLICFRTTNQPGTGGRFNIATLWGATGPGYLSGSGNQSVANVEIFSTGYCTMKLQNAANTAFTYNVDTTTYVCDGNWHSVVLSLSADGKTARLIVDGAITSATTAASMGSSTYTIDAIGATLTTNGENTSSFNGDIAYFAQWNTELDATTANELSRGFAYAWSNDDISSRINRLLALASFHPGSAATFQAFGSQGVLGSMGLTGRTALDAIQESADTENGQFAVDCFGNPTLYGHLWRWIQNTPIVTFGENLAGGEVPVKDDIKFEQDPAHLYNDIQITCDGAADATDVNRLQEVEDTTSQTSYFPQTLTRTINPQQVLTGNSMANYLLSLYKDPHTRLQGVTVDLAHSAALQKKVMGLHFADLVRVMKRPTAAPAKQLDGFIEQLEWSGDDTGEKLQLHLQVSPASQYRYGIISAAWAQLQSSYAAGISTITVGPVAGVNSIPAQQIIPGAVGYQMTLGYGTAAAETVTVQSVQTVSSGYSTVQITLTAPTANSHTVNDYLCDPLPGTATLPPGGTYPTCYDAAALTGGTTPLLGF